MSSPADSITVDTESLKFTLDNLARTTWTDISDGRRLGVGMGEVGITDRNMLALRRQYPTLLVHKHSVSEEVRTGADWEWWLHISGVWICLVFQAKVLSPDGRYAGITKGQAQGKPQVDLLLRSCLLRSERLNGAVWPLYCFYNSWSGGWPESVQRYDGKRPYDPPQEELKLYGCAVADAWNIKRVLVHESYSSRRTILNSYLPISRPWSMIFPDQNGSMSCDPKGIMRVLSSWMPGQRKRISAMPSDDVIDEEMNGLRPRNRLAIYTDPAPISQPPEYVLDLLQGGAARPRRLKPLARRVVVLPELM